MKTVYPIVLTQVTTGFVVYVPDLSINTEGADLADAIAMARDAIGIWGITEQDTGRAIPDASPLDSITHEDGEIVTLVDIDFDAYRRAHDMKTVRKNVTLPSWLNTLAENAGVNFSQVLQEGLRARLNVQDKY